MCPMTKNGSTNTTGVRHKNCPIEVFNNFVVLLLVPKKQGVIITPESTKVSENSAIVIGVGGDVPNKEYLLGKHVLFAKFRHYEPFQFTDKDGKITNLIMLTDSDLVGSFVDQTQSSQYRVPQAPQPHKLTRA